MVHLEISPPCERNVSADKRKQNCTKQNICIKGHLRIIQQEHHSQAESEHNSWKRSLSRWKGSSPSFHPISSKSSSCSGDNLCNRQLPDLNGCFYVSAVWMKLCTLVQTVRSQQGLQYFAQGTKGHFWEMFTHCSFITKLN